MLACKNYTCNLCLLASIIDSMTATDRYNEALEQLRTAEEALDQARAMFKDLDLDKYRNGAHGQSVASLADHAVDLIRAIETVECDDCGNALADNEACLAGTCHLEEAEAPLTPEQEDARDEARYYAALELRCGHSI